LELPAGCNRSLRTIGLPDSRFHLRGDLLRWRVRDESGANHSCGIRVRQPQRCVDRGDFPHPVRKLRTLRRATSEASGVSDRRSCPSSVSRGAIREGVPLFCGPGGVSCCRLGSKVSPPNRCQSLRLDTQLVQASRALTLAAYFQWPLLVRASLQNQPECDLRSLWAPESVSWGRFGGHGAVLQALGEGSGGQNGASDDFEDSLLDTSPTSPFDSSVVGEV
jgi:hypothetical protein